MSLPPIENPIKKIGDVIRGSIIAERPEHISALFQSITERVTAQGGKFYVKNFWDDPQPLSLGYVGVHIKIRMPLSQRPTNTKHMLMEVQLHTKAIMDGTEDCAKEIAHRIYKTPREAGAETISPELAILISTSQLVYLTAMTRLLASPAELARIRAAVPNFQRGELEAERRKTQLVTETALLLYNKEIRGEWNKELQFLTPLAKEVVAVAWMQAAQKINQMIRLPNVRLDERGEWTNTATTVDEIYADAREIAPFFRDMCNRAASSQPGCFVNFGPNNAHMIKERESLLAKIAADQKEELKRCLTHLLRKIGKSWAEITESNLLPFGDFSGLHTLNLSNCHGITDSDLSFLAHLPALETLNLAGCSQITDAGLAHLGRLRTLRYLNLSGCDKITDVGIGHLWPLGLQRLNLLGCNLVTETGLVRAGQRPPAAPDTSFRRAFHALTGRLRAAVVQAPQPSRPSRNSVVTLHAQRPSNLGSVTSEQRNRLGISQETNLSTLQDLELDGTEIRESDWTLMANLPLLNSLTLSNASDVDFSQIRRLSGLQNLKITLWTELTDSHWVHLGRLSTLKSLDIDSGDLTDSQRVHLGRLSALQSLSLYATDKNVACAAGLRRLRSLNLKGGGDSSVDEEEIRDRDLACLTGLSALQSLQVFNCWGIEGSGLAYLAKLPVLQTLDLVCCGNLKESNLVHLERFHSLYTVRLGGPETEISSGALDRLRRRGLDVEYEAPREFRISL